MDDIMEFDLGMLFEYREKLLKEVKEKYNNGNIDKNEYEKTKKYIETYY